MNERVLSFGDLHLNWQAAYEILKYARTERLQKVINLGDEGHKFYPLIPGEPQDYNSLYGQLRSFRDEDPARVLVCLLGDKTGAIPSDLWLNYVGVDKTGEVSGKIWYREENILAVHHGEWLIDDPEARELITGWDNYEPLVIFHGSSHSMGVDTSYRWLNSSELVKFLQGNREERYVLEPKKVYWINPGGNFYYIDGATKVANLAVYDPSEQEILLKTIAYTNIQILS